MDCSKDFKSWIIHSHYNWSLALCFLLQQSYHWKHHWYFESHPISLHAHRPVDSNFCILKSWSFEFMSRSILYSWSCLSVLKFDVFSVLLVSVSFYSVVIHQDVMSWVVKRLVHFCSKNHKNILPSFFENNCKNVSYSWSVICGKDHDVGLRFTLK